MKVVGTIVEYNPLHNGHIYAINQIKKESDADILIAVMSGNFTMRGELSLFDKFKKTEYALKAGLNLIIELPFVYTVQNSDIFAKRAVELLCLAKVDEIWIGSESNNSNLFKDYYQKWIDSHNQELIKEQIKKGLSYKSATSIVIDLPSNDLLGFSYYKALKELNSNIELKTIKRVGSNYLDLTPNKFASSLAIRSNLSLLKDFCPAYLEKELIRDNELIFPYLKYLISSHKTQELKEFFLVDEGLENSLKNISKYQNLKDFTDSLVSKRYTKSRINRMLCYILLNITKIEMQNINNTKANFIRVLGYDELGLVLLKTLKKEITIYTNIKEGLNNILDLEIRITKVLDNIYNTSTFKLEQTKPIEI